MSSSLKFNLSIVASVAVAILVLRFSNRLLMFGEFIEFEVFHLFHHDLPPHSITWLQRKPPPRQFDDVKMASYRGSRRPNILLIVADDLGINDISGGSGVSTPNIDSIANMGINFTQAYAAQSTCAPSRAALFTGRIPSKFGFEFTPVPNWMARVFALKKPKNAPQPAFHYPLLPTYPHIEDFYLPEEIPTLAEVLKTKGYSTFHIGKWDGGYTNDHSPLTRGYDESLHFLQGACLYGKVGDPKMVESGRDITFDEVLKRVLSFSLSHNNGELFEPNEYMTDYFGNQASALIEALAYRNRNHSTESGLSRSADEPWFLSLAFNAPHNPFQALKSDYENPEIQRNCKTRMQKIYAAMILALDRNIGKVLQTLKNFDELNNTIIVFTSDNGGASYSSLPHHNLPFRGWKGTFFEGGIRVPLFIQWLQGFKNDVLGKKIEDMTMHIDLFPSLVNIASSFTSAAAAVPSSLVSANNSNRMKELSSLEGIDVLSRFINHEHSKPLELKPEMELFSTNAETSPMPMMSHAPFNHYYSNRIFYWKNANYYAIRYDSYKLQIHANNNKKLIWFHNLQEDPTEKRDLIPFINDYLRLSIHEQSDLDLLDSNLKGIITNFINPMILSSDVATQQQNSSIAELPSLTSLNPGSDDVTKAYFHLTNLLTIYDKLKLFLQEQPEKPLWPSLVDVPICIDKPVLVHNICSLQDEYVYLAN